MKAGLLQLVAHEHSGKMRPHAHTSYASLVFLLILSGIVLLASSLAVQAAPPAVNPQSGSVGLSGTVPGPPPTTSAVILSPQSGSHVSSSPVTVSGTCPLHTFVSVENNQVFAGVTSCGANGTFSLSIDLFAGANVLVARVSDALGQFGPDSAAVTVFYDVSSPSLAGGLAGKPLFLQSTSMVLGTSPAQILVRSVTIVGGVGPYAVSFDWGDGKSDLVSTEAEGAVEGRHAYSQPGNYQVIVRATDARGNNALLELVTVVNGPIAAYGANNDTGLGAMPGVLLTAWPLYTLAFFMVGFFWLGERHENRKSRRNQLHLQ